MSTIQQFQEAADKATQASAQADTWANGPVNTTVPTDSGPVPTIAEFNRAAQARVDASIEAIGWVLAGDFTAGCTVTDRNQYVLVVGGSGYRWDGVLPKVVAPGSSPAPIATGSWVLVPGVVGVFSNTGEKSFVSGCVLRRNTAVSPEWGALDDSSHHPINFNSVALANAGADVQVSHKSGPVGSVLAVTDETFALDGVTLGSSGGGGTTNVSIGVPCNYEIDLDTLTVTCNSRYLQASRFTVTVATTGEITLGHPSSKSNFNPIISHTTKTLTAEKLSPHYLRGTLGGASKLFLTARAQGLVQAPSGVFAISNTAWVPSDVTFSWNDTTKELTVTHPTIIGNGAVNATSYSSSVAVHLAVYAVTSTSFVVKFTRVDAGVVTAGAMTAFSFERGDSVVKLPTGKLLVDLGRVQALASQVDSASGNIWFMSVQKDNG